MVTEEENQAIQQLTGFVHAKEGFDVISLIEAMGLRKEEWFKIRDEPFLPADIVAEIDLHFGIL